MSDQVHLSKGQLDPTWVDELIHYTAGPTMAMINAKSPSACKEVTHILHKAVNDLYKSGQPKTTNDWVLILSDRVDSLVRLYVTSLLMNHLDNGMPEVPVLVKLDDANWGRRIAEMNRASKG